MTTVIPAIDIIDGKVVRLTQGDYNQVESYALDPVEQAIRFEEAGAKRIHLVDLDGAKSGKPTNHHIFKKIRQAISCEIEIGGGIRTAETVETLLELGINYAILGSVLIQDFDAASKIIESFPNKIIAGIDEKNNQIAVSGWEENSQTDTVSFLNQLETLSLESIIFTEISRDGTLSGPNIERLTTICKATSHAIIASGGVASKDDITSLRQLNLSNLKGCIVGKALLSGKMALSDIKDA